ncbi:sensor histidine kinase [Acinetobacter lactucae]|uniref:sensor histidine kinase n=1 Tax=Acinetobacter lactucae TaxID=1785128 RepID=UPI00237B4925|nr:sensor histidine kinase [Acinetobacter lactucae]MDD9316037.1 sensor histidine kinase [Acinetobacter lactucae]
MTEQENNFENKSGSYKIRPAGRHLSTIGKELIQNEAAAIIELVKNAYDADADEIYVDVSLDYSSKSVEITVSDNGHGMDIDTFLNKWMVPSTDDKLLRKISKNKNRIMQGRKGIGRYAVAVLGNVLDIHTTTKDLSATSAKINWDIFNTVQYLDEINIDVKNVQLTEGKKGTILKIYGNEEYFETWTARNKKALEFELKKLISPLDAKKNDFKIFLKITPNENLESDEDMFALDNNDETSFEEIKPFPIVKYFDYRIQGEIAADGTGKLTYSCQKELNLPDIIIDFNYYHPTNCGALKFDFRVYDRESDALDDLVERTKRVEEVPLEKKEIRALLDTYHGVGVFRGGFRIRPLGDVGYDWMDLNLQRVNNPSLRISVNQIIGYVRIESEEQSKLFEKSARDGLRDNEAYKNLVAISQRVLRLLEENRFKYRESTGKSRKNNESIDEKLNNIFSSERLSSKIQNTLEKSGLSSDKKDKISKDIMGLVEEDAKSKTKELEFIKRAVAIYQGQATLGKIINRLIHEGRRPLNYFQHEIPNLKRWKEKYDESHEEKHFAKVLERVDGVLDNTKHFVVLFKKIDPLATARRPNKKDENLKKIILSSINIFEKDINDNAITVNISCSDELTYLCWKQDIIAILYNLLENSIYWMVTTNCLKKHIEITVTEKDGKFESIIYSDTGPGIKPEDIESLVIFTPGFSGKPDGGTGLGLSIAGESAVRNNLKLQAEENLDGALFKLISKGDEK